MKKKLIAAGIALAGITMIVIVLLWAQGNWRSAGNKVTNLGFKTITGSDEAVDFFGSATEDNSNKTRDDVWGE